MEHQFTKHYTLTEARALLPQVRQWLGQLEKLHHQMRKDEQILQPIVAGGSDAGGKVVERWIRTIANLRVIVAEFEAREIQIKDVERGLLDFPAIIGDREVFLCWEKDEDDIEHWHDLDSGYAGRERL
jgi:hypothetical protein